jgi:hypothetical protein
VDVQRGSVLCNALGGCSRTVLVGVRHPHCHLCPVRHRLLHERFGASAHPTVLHDPPATFCLFASRLSFKRSKPRYPFHFRHSLDIPIAARFLLLRAESAMFKKMSPRKVACVSTSAIRHLASLTRFSPLADFVNVQNGVEGDTLCGGEDARVCG